MPLLSSIYDEPFSDVSQIPTYLISKLAKRHVTVVLSGDAGDELFGGYNRYRFAPSLWAIIRLVPITLRKLIFNIINDKPLTLYGKGKNSREWIFVDDHCEALFKVFKYGTKGEFYNIGSNINSSNFDIAKLLIDISKKD